MMPVHPVKQKKPENNDHFVKKPTVKRRFFCFWNIYGDPSSNKLKKLNNNGETCGYQ